MPLTPLPDLTLVIQAGGQSKRMGRDKALLPFPQEPLIRWVLTRLAPLAEHHLVTTNRPEDYAFLGVPLVPDRLPGTGALGGLLTALEAAPTECVAVVACDMPFARPDLFRQAWEALQRHPAAPAAVPRTSQGWEPFHAVYRRTACLPSLRTALAQGERRIQRWLDRLAPLALEVPNSIAFWNLNTPEDYRRALEHLAQQPDLKAGTAPEG